MDEEKYTPEQSSNPEVKRRGRKQKRKYPSRTPEWREKFLAHQKWTLTEKSRLLEALKRYESHNISSIAKVVGTKSEEEVEEKIKLLRGLDPYRFARARVDGRGPEKAPIEAWIDLVQEMTNHESADYSQFVPRVLGFIARNEQFADSGNPQLKWKNIYQFLADITEDKVDAHKLTDLEYFIVLDLMHNLGNTLLKSDTSEQRQILDFKYNLLNFKVDTPGKAYREHILHRVAQALNNDFWEPEDLQKLLPPASKSTVTSSNSATATVVGEGMASTSSAKTDLQTVPRTSQGMSAEASTSSGHVSSSQQNNDPREITAAESDENNTASSGVGLSQGSKAGEKLLRPKYFTLNPLCVPTQLLVFRPQSQKRAAFESHGSDFNYTYRASANGRIN